jgi:integrase
MSRLSVIFSEVWIVIRQQKDYSLQPQLFHRPPRFDGHFPKLYISINAEAMGSLYKRRRSHNWMMAVMIHGVQYCKSTHTSNKRKAQQLLARWETEVFEGRFHLPRSTPPHFQDWADDFQTNVPQESTRKRYESSIKKLMEKLTGIRLSDISTEQIDDYKKDRLAEGVQPATINHDLRVLRRMMRLAERRQLIPRNSSVQIEFLKQQAPRPPHIVGFDEEEKLIAVAVPYLRVLIVLILETGMRSHREALSLRWDAIDFINDVVRVRESKTRAGIRSIPLSARCKAELLRWRELLGSDFSPFVFPNFRNPGQPAKDIRKAWAKALKDAGIEYFWLYNLRHTHSSRLSAAGVPDLFVAQMIGHSSPSILKRYSKAIDEYRRDAILKLEQMRASHRLGSPTNSKAN